MHFPARLVHATVTLGLFALGLSLGGCEGTPRIKPVWVEIPRDASVAAMAESLSAHGIIESAAEFERVALKNHRYRDINPGVYPLKPGTSALRVLQVLRLMTLAEVAVAVEQTVGVPRDSFVHAARDAVLRAHLEARAATVEGYLYPTAYYVTLPATPLQVVRQMTDTFEARWPATWNARLDSIGITRDDAVTLASIVAGEMPAADDIAHVAAVYHNRLTRGMRLQADPTVIYALGERRRLTNDDYHVASEYNTYAVRGLPPGPIGEPSTVSLEATLYPGETDDLFFVGRLLP